VIAPPSSRNGRFLVTAVRSTVLSSLVALLLVLAAHSIEATPPDRPGRTNSIGP
jgi:hypothetical protein